MSREPRGVPFWSPVEIEASIAGTLSHLEQNGVLAYPTETVYGLGGAIDRTSVDRLVALKRRPAAKPFLLLIASADMIARLDLQLSREASLLAARFWPGPLTLVLPGGERRVPERLRGPEGGIGVRWTSHAGLQRLITAMGEPLTSTSANLPGRPAATNASGVLEEWSAQVAAGDMRVLDGGTLRASPASTVVDCTTRHPRVIRPGAIAAQALRDCVPSLVGDR